MFRNIIKLVNEMSAKEGSLLNRWFNDSKVVDHEGKPLIVYHGTLKDFQQFERPEKYKNETSGLGYWFTNDSEVAGEFAVDADYFWGEEIRRDEIGGNIKPVFIKMENPKVYVSRGPDSTKIAERNQAIEAMKQLKIDIKNNRDAYIELQKIDYTTFMNAQRDLHDRLGKLDFLIRELNTYTKDADPTDTLMDERDEFAYYGREHKSPYKGYWREHMMADHVERTNKDFVTHLKARGYDGIILQGTKVDSLNDDVINQYCVFEPNQIKSIFAKEFNPNSSNITEEN